MERELAKAKEEARIAKNCYESERKRRRENFGGSSERGRDKEKTRERDEGGDFGGREEGGYIY